MLLRSSSTPVLESLLPPLVSRTELLTEIKNEGPEAVLLKSLSLPSRGSNPNLVAHHTHVECPPLNPNRKVLSEADLCSLGGPLTPARIAAHSLLRNASIDHCLCSGFNLDTSSSHVRKGSPPTSLPLNWQRSLGSFPSELPSLFFNCDSPAILEGVLELASSNSSAASEEDEERERKDCLFDKISLPVSKRAENVKGELANDVGFKIDVDDEAELSQSTLRKMQGVGSEERGMVMNHDNQDTHASFSGRQEPNYMPGRGRSYMSAGRESSLSNTILVQQMYGQASQPNYVYHGDQWEMAPGAGDGGRGSRLPPTMTGGGGYGGEAGGRGERSSNQMDLHYQNMVTSDPGNPLILGNFAQYLAEVKHDYQKAEEFFQRAILANPSDGEVLGQYAKMLWEVQKDHKRAAAYFERAVEAAPYNSCVMAAYASFLWSSEEEEEQENVDEAEGSNLANVRGSLFSLVSAGLV